MSRSDTGKPNQVRQHHQDHCLSMTTKFPRELVMSHYGQ